MAVAAQQRFTRQHPCPVCGGHESIDRGIGQRCYGFLSDDREWAHCTRPECAGDLPLHEGSNTYAHRLEGPCRCGREHGVQPPAHEPSPRWRIWRRRQREPLGIFVCAYVYRTAEGRPLHRTVRYRDPKSFRQERYDRGRWRPGVVGHVERVLYRLPELLAAPYTEPVYFPEGEKDADRLATLGLVATTTACGARCWEPHYARWLKGRHVVILEDNDEDGRARSQRLARALRDVAASVQVISFAHMPEHSDVSDWLDAGGTIAALRRVVAETLHTEVAV
jgi:hypothetical protein